MVASLFQFPESFNHWLDRWQQRLAADSVLAEQRQAQMYRSNPVFIPRNHLVEEAIAAATGFQDFEPFHQLLEVLSKPFDYRESLARYAIPPAQDQVVQQTFCGT
jgi:serine/tyrosine/threonine adenylyltransferase